MKIAALAGGVGGAKLLTGLQLVNSSLTAVVNTGDDDEIYGVHVSPDLDIVTYWLAGIADTERGWGIRDDTFGFVDALEGLGAEAWFRLGDRDLATCVRRTARMRDGASLTSATDEIRRALGVPTEILPMSDDPVRTKVVTTDGRTLAFQHYFVKERSTPEVAEVLFEGISEAKPSPEVIERIVAADRVVICPSNPLLSTGPILALSGVRDAIRDHPSVTGVSPIVGGAAIKGPLDRMLEARGQEVSPASVASMYAGLCDRFVIDRVDARSSGEVASAGDCEVIVTDTIMSDRDASRRLAEAVLS